MIALVTGASAGFGEAITRLLVARGHKVIATARRGERLTALQMELGENIYPLVFDIQNIDAMQMAIDSLPDEWQFIDLLVNNAGLALGLAPAQSCDLNHWLQMIDTNIRGLVAITHKILPAMVEKNHGHIINLGSISGSYPYFGSNVYGASKAFVEQFSLNLRADLFGTKVRVSNFEPGIIGGTEFSNVRLGDDEKAGAIYHGFENMTPEDIAEMVVWCAELPEKININRMEIMPTAQTFAGLKVAKEV